MQHVYNHILYEYREAIPAIIKSNPGDKPLLHCNYNQINPAINQEATVLLFRWHSDGVPME